MDIYPDFTKIRKIPPAFAGVLVDWSMGSREITATLIDLIVRGCLSVEGNSLSIGKKQSMKKFELEFVSIIFGNKTSLSLVEISEIVFKKEFGQLIKIISRGMVEEGLVEKDVEKKMADTAKDFLTENFGDNAKPNIPNTENYHVASVWFYPISWIVCILLIFTGLFLLFWKNPFLNAIGMLIEMFAVFFLFALLFIHFFAKGISKKFGSYDGFLSEKGRAMKSYSESLKEFMKKFPLLEDRLANELVGHAIAFGIGKKWMKKLGKSNAFVKMAFEVITPKSNITLQFIDLKKYMNEFKATQE